MLFELTLSKILISIKLPSKDSEFSEEFTTGLKVTNIRKNLDKRHLRGLERDGEYIKLYDIRLQEGANVFFAGRIGTHNCGSAIAASSVVSEWVKGKKIDDVSITNHEIATHLNLPPVKLHCSMLAEDAIKSAIEDYKEKNKK